MELQPTPKFGALVTDNLSPPKKKGKTKETKSKIGDVSDLCTDEDSPLAKKLIEEISLLRKKWREYGIKIKCLQNKIRRISRKQGKNKESQDTSTERALKRRRRSSDSADDSSDSSMYLPPSPSAVDKLNLKPQLNIKSESLPINENEQTKSSHPTTTYPNIGLEEDLIETMKAEQEDDPLTFY